MCRTPFVPLRENSIRLNRDEFPFPFLSSSARIATWNFQRFQNRDLEDVLSMTESAQLPVRAHEPEATQLEQEKRQVPEWRQVKAPVLLSA